MRLPSFPPTCKFGPFTWSASLVVALAGLGHLEPALAQRVDDNAATSAADAFGQAIGNERIGLYTVDDG